MKVEFTYKGEVIGQKPMDCIPRKGDHIEIMEERMRDNTGIAKPDLALVLEVQFIWWVIEPGGGAMVTINLG